MGANIYNKLAIAPFCAKKYGPGWVDGWMVDGWQSLVKDCLQQSKKITMTCIFQETVDVEQEFQYLGLVPWQETFPWQETLPWQANLLECHPTLRNRFVNKLGGIVIFADQIVSESMIPNMYPKTNQNQI